MLDLLKSYKTYLSGLWKYRVSGLVAMLITGVLGIIITVVLPGNYEATARAYVDTKSILQPLMQGMTVQPDMQGQIQMMARTLVSRPNLEAIVQATGMDHDVQTQKGREALMQTLEKNIQFKPAGGTNFYSIEYRNQSRETALKVVTMLLDLFVKSTRTGKTADTQQAVQFIDQEIAKARDLLLQTETALKEFKIKHIEVMPNLAQDYVARSADIQRELQTARLEYRQAVNSRTAIRTRLEAVPEYVPVGGGQADGGGSETERRLESARKRLDDLLTQGVQEPYRMFTSRAEYRLSLREDNADLRLTELGRQMGCVDDVRWQAFTSKQEAIEREIAHMRATLANPQVLARLQTPQGTTQAAEEAQGASPSAPQAPAAPQGQNGTSKHSLHDLLKRPDVSLAQLASLMPEEFAEVQADPRVAEQVEIQIKYQGYIDRQKLEVQRMAQQEATPIPADLDYTQISGLSNEVRQKLIAQRPQTIGQAGRIPGMTPAAVSLLLVHLKKRRKVASATEQRTPTQPEASTSDAAASQPQGDSA